MAECLRCGGVVSLVEGRPRVGSAGVELWHSRCWDEREQPVHVPAVRAEPQLVLPTPVARPRRAPVAVAIGGALAILGAVWAVREARARPVTALVIAQFADSATVALHSELAARDTAPPRPEPLDSETRFPMPIVDGVPIDDLYPSLCDWIHPVAASAELYPPLASRHFGAERRGVMRTECGAGHCGIDLDGPRGRPVLAVAAGRIVRVEHDEMGADGRSGRYVRIQHDDGTLTSYMHLDDIANDLDVGGRVEAGQQIGTLGATAVYSAPPHLHFALELPNNPDERGDTSNTHYIDPAPFLVRATIAPLFEHRHPIKPAF